MDLKTTTESIKTDKEAQRIQFSAEGLAIK